ncbi:helix-turn-helix domain-containing protein [Rhodococcus qingshengii]
MQEVDIGELFGQLVAKFRVDKGLSQTALAARLSEEIGKNVDPTTITRMERGSRPTSVVELYALANIFGVSARDLLPGHHDSPTELAARQLKFTEANLRRERIQAEARLSELGRDIERLAAAVEAAEHLTKHSESKNNLTTDELADLETLARFGFGGYLEIPFMNIFHDLLTDEEVSKANAWAKFQTAESLGLEEEDVPDEVVYYLGLIDYLRQGGGEGASEA